MSNKTMTLTEISKTSKEFKDTHTLQVGGFRSGGRTTTRDLILSVRDEMLKIRDEMLKIRAEMLKGFAQVNARIDNLVTKNNLKE